MRAALAISLAVLCVMLGAGCEAIDDFSPFHVVFYDGGGADFAAPIADGFASDVRVCCDFTVAPADLATPADLACEGVVLDGGTCFFNYCPNGYVWTNAQAQARCSAIGATLCTMGEIKSAFEAGYDSCCFGWTSTPCDGGLFAGYANSKQTGGCTAGTNLRCDANTIPEGANCCRR